MKNHEWELGRELEYRKGDRTELKELVHRDRDMDKKWTRGKECVRKKEEEQEKMGMKKEKGADFKKGMYW